MWSLGTTRKRNENHGDGSIDDRGWRCAVSACIGSNQSQAERESEKSVGEQGEWKMTTPTIPTTDWLTAAEAAEYLRVKARTLLLWARQGKVKAFALSGTSRKTWRFRRADLDEALLEASVLLSESLSVCPAERMEQ